jgi:hypothetical protein
MQNITADKGSLLVVSRQEVSSWANATLDKDVTLIAYPDDATPEQIAILIRAAKGEVPLSDIASWNMPPMGVQPEVPIYVMDDYEYEEDEEDE